MPLNGIVWISAGFGLCRIIFWADNLNLIPSPICLRTATACTMAKLEKGKTFGRFYQEARDFAYGEYLEALFQGENKVRLKKEAISSQIWPISWVLDKAYILKIQKSKFWWHRFQKRNTSRERKSIGNLRWEISSQRNDLVAEGPYLVTQVVHDWGVRIRQVFNNYLYNWFER